jgi:hypothetical protein
MNQEELYKQSAKGFVDIMIAADQKKLLGAYKRVDKLAVQLRVEMDEYLQQCKAAYTWHISKYRKEKSNERDRR